MPTADHSTTPAGLRPLVAAWLGLVALTLLSVGVAHWLTDATWLPVFVAVIVWLKGTLVARKFIEVQYATPFIRRLVTVFIAIVPIAQILTGFFGYQIARWTLL